MWSQVLPNLTMTSLYNMYIPGERIQLLCRSLPPSLFAIRSIHADWTVVAPVDVVLVCPWLIDAYVSKGQAMEEYQT